MHIRSYGGPSDVAAMQDLAATCIAADPSCFILHPGDIPHRMFGGLRFESLDELVTIWEDEEEGIVGWALVVPRHRGFDAQVHPDWRDRLELEVLSRAESETIAAAEKRGIEGDRLTVDADLCDAIRIACLEELGWERGTNDYTVTKRSLADVPEPVVPEGFGIRTVRGPGDADRLADVHSGSFGSEWTAELYRDAVMSTPFYDPKREFVAVAPDGRFAAFTMTWHDHRNRLGLFEPVGTHHEFRRLGLARALLFAGMRSMREAGMEAAIVTHETSNAASTALYAAAGFVPFIENVGYSKRFR